MRIKIIKFTGWFGVLTPVYAAGVITALCAFGEPNIGFVRNVLLVSFANLFIGSRILKKLKFAPEAKGGKV